MQRVAIVATASGCGKTTVGRSLAAILGAPFVELDAIHWQAGWRELDADDLRRRVAPLVARRRLGDRRLLSREARRPRPRGGGHGGLARPPATGLAPAARRPDAAPRHPSRGAVEREPRVALECPRRLRLALPLRARERAAASPPLPARARALPRRPPPLARRGRGVPPLGSETGAKLRNPGRARGARARSGSGRRRTTTIATPSAPNHIAQYRAGTQPFSRRSRRTPRARTPYFSFGPLTATPPRGAAPAR